MSTVQAGGLKHHPLIKNETLTGLIVFSERVENKKLNFLFLPKIKKKMLPIVAKKLLKSTLVDISLYYSKNNSDLTKNSEDEVCQCVPLLVLFKELHYGD